MFKYTNSETSKYKRALFLVKRSYAKLSLRDFQLNSITE